METKPIKLNLGSGGQPLAGYVNLDARYGDTVSPIWQRAGDKTFGDGVDEIRASHILEHFPHGQTQQIINHWREKLRPGGVLKIAVPDFQKIAQAYLHQRDIGYNVPAEAYIMGGQTDEHDYHRALFDEPGLRKMMAAAGLVDIKPWTSEIQDCAALPISLNLMGTKPPLDQPEPVAYTGRRPAAQESAIRNPQSAIPVKIAAIMSVPRLSITSNVACLLRTIAECGLPCQPAQGVFWHHALTRQIEDRIAEGFEYLLAIDFDSWFLPGHVRRLVELLLEHPEADALCAVQCQREHSLPILGIHDHAGQPIHELPRLWFEKPLTPIHIGHFGLTVFRSSCFADLPKPWLRDEPDPNGSWREGRRDADVAFWHNCEAAGKRLYMANEVSIGHLQEICTFSGPARDNWRPVHVYVRDLIAGKIPPHCDPAYRIGTDSPPPVKE